MSSFTLATARELSTHVLDSIGAAGKRKDAKVGLQLNDDGLEKQISQLLTREGVSSDKTTSHLSVLLVSNALKHDENLTDKHISEYIAKLQEGAVLLFRLDIANHVSILPQLTHQFELFTNAENGVTFGFDMKYILPISDSIAVRGNHKDLVWALTKVKREQGEGFVTQRDFLDKTQYQVDGIKAYEFVFGEGFISPGGRAQNTAFLDELKLRAGERMLDIGSGIGGSPLQVAQEYGVECVGVDLSTNMLNMGIDLAHEAKDPRVSNMVANVMTFDYPANSFDVIYSRDCIQHIEDVHTLYKRFYAWLRPGGRLLTTCYTKGKAEFTEQFAAYTKQRHYGLQNKDEFLKACQSAGYTHYAFTDLTPLFSQILNKELAFVDANKKEFVSKFSETRFSSLTEGWRDKLAYIEADNHNWTQIYCTK